MNPSIRIAVGAVLLLALARPASSAGWDAERILKLRDPEAAAAFLADDAGRARLRAEDPERFREVFARAADLKSVADLVRGSGDSFILREKLRALADCEFCQSPGMLQAWTRTYVPGLGAERLDALTAALLAWDTLPSPLRRWLSGRGLDEAAWGPLRLPRRSDEIQPWLEAELARVMTEMPRTGAELKDFVERSDAVALLLPREMRDRLDDRTDALESSVDGLEAARAKAAASPDPAIRRRLKAVEDAAGLDERLALLSSLFDGLGIRDDSLKVAAPPRPGQVFDDASRRVTADLLRGGLLATVAGTWAGDELAAFYRTHALVLRIAPTGESGTIGWYSRGVMSFNEDYVVKFLKLKGRDIHDLQADPALLANLTADVAPLFVHEATHQRQEAWRGERGLPKFTEQNAELEAKQAEAVFTLEKSLRDPVFRAALENDARTPGPARSALREAEKLRDLGPAAYRDKVRTFNYADVPSLEGGVHARIRRGEAFGGFVEAELARRAALPRDEAARLERGPGELGDFDDDDSLRRELAKAGTPLLRAMRDGMGPAADANADAYPAYLERQKLVDEQTEDRLNRILSGDGLVNTRRAPEVPSPALR